MNLYVVHDYVGPQVFPSQIRWRRGGIHPNLREYTACDISSALLQEREYRSCIHIGKAIHNDIEATVLANFPPCDFVFGNTLIERRFYSYRTRHAQGSEV